MKATDLSYYITNYLTKYLPGIVGLSINTIMSYRDMFSLMIEYYEKLLKINPDKLKLNDLTYRNIENFLNWLEVKRKCSVSTRNVRLSAIHAFAPSATIIITHRVAVLPH